MTQLACLWTADRTLAPAITPTALPEKVDVAIIGSGYTGLQAACSLADAGASVAVLDAEDVQRSVRTAIESARDRSRELSKG